MIDKDTHRPSKYNGAITCSTCTEKTALLGLPSNDGSAAGLAAATTWSSSPAVESTLAFAVCAVGAYIGTFIRIGIASFYRGGGTTPAGFTVLYAQLLGCFIMGCVSEYQKPLMAGSRLHRLLYIFVATGLCGSITTFSTWQYESSKLLLQQLDLSAGGISGSYNAGHLLEWATTLFLGFGLPLVALHGGQHVSQAWPVSTSWRVARPAAVEAGILVVYAATTAGVVVAPLLCDWPALMWAPLFGSAGAYLRFRLGPLNKGMNANGWCCRRRWGCCCTPRVLLISEEEEGGEGYSTPPCCPAFTDGSFPVGTFAANLSGSLIQAVAVSLSKFVVSYHDTLVQAVLFGVSLGFCGCLTTLSSFVLELHRLPRRAAYVYGAASYAACIAAYLLFFTAPAAYLAVSSASAPFAFGPHVEVCAAYAHLCGLFLDRVACPQAQRSEPGVCASLAAFNASCRCGALDASVRVGELLVDAQSRQRLAAAVVPVYGEEGYIAGIL